MSEPILVFTADNHLQPQTWTKHPELRNDAYVSLLQIISYCREHRLPLALLGDLFNKSRPDPESVSAYFEAVSIMQDLALPVWYVEGNHDRDKPAWAGIHPWARSAATQFRLGNRRFFGVDFTTAANLPEALKMIPSDTEVLLAHQAWSNIQRIGHTDGSFNMIPHGLTLLTGDYHVTNKYTGNASNGEPIIAWSPGSTSMQALNENPDKFFGVLFNDLSVQWIPLITRAAQTLTLDTETALADFIRTVSPHPSMLQKENVSTVSVPEVIRKPILRIKFSESISDAYVRLTAAFGEHCHLFLEPQRETITEVIDETATPAGAFDNLITAIGELVSPDSPVYTGARRTLETQDIKAEILAMFEEFKVQYAANHRPDRLPPSHVVASRG